MDTDRTGQGRDRDMNTDRDRDRDGDMDGDMDRDGEREEDRDTAGIQNGTGNFCGVSDPLGEQLLNLNISSEFETEFENN
jgi:hypothetical protein